MHAAAPILIVPAVPMAVADVRRYVVDACIASGWAGSAETVAVLVSEIATNAVLHADGHKLRVRVLEVGLRLRIEVRDGSPKLPIPRRAPSHAENGRGLALVDALATRWGVEAQLDGKTTWFEIEV